MKRKNFRGKNNPFYGKKHTDESKRKMSLSHQGQIPWNKGKTGIYPEETLLKMRKPKTEKHKRKLSITRLKKFEKITDKKIRKFEQDINEHTEIKIAFGEILGTIPSDACFKKRDKRLYNYFLGSIDREFITTVSSRIPRASVPEDEGTAPDGVGSSNTGVTKTFRRKPNLSFEVSKETPSLRTGGGFIERLSNNFARLGVKAKVLRRSSGLWYVQVCRRWFQAFVPYLKKKDNKWIFSSKTLNSSDKKFKAAIMRSFSDADGTVTYTIKNGKYYSRHISIYNSVKALLLQVKEILSSFGILSRIYLNRNERKDRIKNQLFEFSATYDLSITNYENLKLFYDSVGFGLTRKMKKLKKLLGSYKCIGKQYTIEDYRKAFFLYDKVGNCREVSRRLDIPPQTVQNWVLHNVKPRLVKIHLRERTT